MATREHHVWLSFVWFSYVYSSIVIGCVTKYSNDPYVSHTCVPADGSQVIVQQVGHPQCVWRCLQIDQCRYFNYNTSSDQCELVLGQCVYLVPATGVLVNAYGPERHTCLHWGSDQDERLVPVEIKDDYNHMYVVRIAVAQALVIGKLVLNIYPNVYANNAGDTVAINHDATLGHELLMKDPTCTLTWLQYTPHDEIPTGAVIGGRLIDGSPTYVVMIPFESNHLAFGYYDIMTALGHYEFYGAHTASNMFMLILLWHYSVVVALYKLMTAEPTGCYTVWQPYHITFQTAWKR